MNKKVWGWLQFFYIFFGRGTGQGGRGWWGGGGGLINERPGKCLSDFNANERSWKNHTGRGQHVTNVHCNSMTESVKPKHLKNLHKI